MIFQITKKIRINNKARRRPGVHEFLIRCGISGAALWWK
jgi:hypothetical protein